jgi:hypothetical protein
MFRYVRKGLIDSIAVPMLQDLLYGRPDLRYLGVKAEIKKEQELVNRQIRILMIRYRG